MRKQKLYIPVSAEFAVSCVPRDRNHHNFILLLFYRKLTN